MRWLFFCQLSGQMTDGFGEDTSANEWYYGTTTVDNPAYDDADEESDEPEWVESDINCRVEFGDIFSQAKEVA